MRLSIRKVVIVLSFGFIVFPFQSCEILKQAGQMANLAKCDFRLHSVDQLTLAGVNVQNIHKLSELNLMDLGKLTTAVASGQFPLDFTLNVEAKNPNTAAASLTKMDWILFIDGIEMTRGTNEKQVSIPANNGTAVIPMKLSLDLKQILSGKSADAILNFAMNLAGVGSKPTRFSMKMQPSVNVSGFEITYPGYITLGTEFGGTSGNSGTNSGSNNNKTAPSHSGGSVKIK